jgi:2-polyprenyl-3-methyl-5-hydroxy-6-metoxy-1,4-benzoquinol methylase
MDEHFKPDRGLSLEAYAARGDVGGAHHLARYLWLTEVLGGAERRVLDLGCGAGYGSFLVATRLPEAAVVGIDYDPAGVRSAQKAYRLPNLRFAVANAMTWDVPELEGEFDTVVSFDSIEHVPHRELVMEQVANHLSDEGSLYLSTPCGTSTNELVPSWDAHRIEYGTASLFDFLSRYFRRIERPENAGFPGLEVFERLRSLGIDYLLRLNPVICREPIRVPNPYR